MKINIFSIDILERSGKSETLPEQPYRQHSIKKLRSYFSHKECFDLRESIGKYAEIVLSNAEIEKELEECQQFYKELLMINQFFGEPLDMQPPNFYFSRTTYSLPM